jgi:hypothetical protein
LLIIFEKLGEEFPLLVVLVDDDLDEHEPRKVAREFGCRATSRHSIMAQWRRAMLTQERVLELGQTLEKIFERHPEADRDTVFRFLRNLEDPPIERLRRALRRASRAPS